MARGINTILAEINTLLQANLSFGSTDYYTLSVIQEQDDKTFPLTRIDDEEGKKISPIDTRGLQIFHRMLGPQENVSLGSGKGSETYRQTIYNMALVGVGYRPMITDSDSWNNPDIADAVQKVLGSNAMLSGKELVIVEGRVITDKQTVLDENYSNQYTKHNILRLIAFQINYTIKQRIIGPSC